MTYFSNFTLNHACTYIKNGGIIAYPTEAVYGLGCDPLNEQAVLNLLTLKQRSVNKGLILIAAEFVQVASFLDYDEKMLDRIMPTWPGAVTWIIPTQVWVPRWLTGAHQSLAVRVTSHPLSNALCTKMKAPLVSTSANPSQKKPALNALRVRQYFPTQELLILNGMLGENKKPSQIYDAVTGACLR